MWLTVHVNILPLYDRDKVRTYSDVIVNVLPLGDTMGLDAGTAASPCSCQVTTIVDGRKPEDEHVATVDSVVLSASVPDDVTTGLVGRTGNRQIRHFKYIKIISVYTIIPNKNENNGK